MRVRRSNTINPEVGMSPLIDAVFLLLIFFLVATMIKKEDRDIDITPPESRSAVKVKPDDDVLVLGVDPRGEFFLQGDPLSFEELRSRLRAVAMDTPDKRIRFDADAKTPYYRVLQVTNQLQFLGLDNVGIRTYDDRYNRR